MKDPCWDRDPVVSGNAYYCTIILHFTRPRPQAGTANTCRGSRTLTLALPHPSRRTRQLVRPHQHYPVKPSIRTRQSPRPDVTRRGGLPARRHHGAPVIYLMVQPCILVRLLSCLASALLCMCVPLAGLATPFPRGAWIAWYSPVLFQRLADREPSMYRGSGSS